MTTRAVLVSLATSVGLGVALMAASFGRMGEFVVTAVALLAIPVGVLVGGRRLDEEDHRRATVGYALVAGALIVAAFCGYLVLVVHPTPL